MTDAIQLQEQSVQNDRFARDTRVANADAQMARLTAEYRDSPQARLDRDRAELRWCAPGSQRPSRKKPGCSRSIASRRRSIPRQMIRLLTHGQWRAAAAGAANGGRGWPREGHSGADHSGGIA